MPAMNKMCGSRKYPYLPPTEGIRFSRGEGGQFASFSSGEGGHRREIFSEGSRDAQESNKEKAQNLPRQFFCEDIKHDES